MKIILRIEEAAMAVIAIFLIARMNLGFSWWVYALLFLSPDISFIGFIFGERKGNAVYNLFHFKAIAVILWISGIIMNMDFLALVGLMMFAHASFDRLVGFNLGSSAGVETVKV